MGTFTPEIFRDAVLAAASQAAQEIVAEEVKAAQQRVAERLNSMVDQLALNALKQYRIEDNSLEITIRVDKRALGLT